MGPVAGLFGQRDLTYRARRTSAWQITQVLYDPFMPKTKSNCARVMRT